MQGGPPASLPPNSPVRRGLPLCARAPCWPSAALLSATPGPPAARPCPGRPHPAHSHTWSPWLGTWTRHLASSSGPNLTVSPDSPLSLPGAQPLSCPILKVPPPVWLPSSPTTSSLAQATPPTGPEVTSVPQLGALSPFCTRWSGKPRPLPQPSPAPASAPPNPGPTPCPRHAGLASQTPRPAVQSRRAPAVEPQPPSNFLPGCLGQGPGRQPSEAPV